MFASPSRKSLENGQEWISDHTRDVAGLIRSYLGETDPKNPLAWPLYGNLSGLPPIRVHVGDDEVLLDDSRRYIERASARGKRQADNF
jgi:acetyl esterase/lipase